VHHEICQLTAGWARALNTQLPYTLWFFHEATTVLPANKFGLWPILCEKRQKKQVIPKIKSGKVVFQQIFKIICETMPNNALI
jgi:hypothetical protein